MNAPIRDTWLFFTKTNEKTVLVFVSGFPRAPLSLSQEKSSGVEIGTRRRHQSKMWTNKKQIIIEKLTYWNLVGVHKLKSKVVFFNQIKVFEDKIKQFLPFGLFLRKNKKGYNTYLILHEYMPYCLVSSKFGAVVVIRLELKCCMFSH